MTWLRIMTSAVYETEISSGEAAKAECNRLPGIPAFLLLSLIRYFENSIAGFVDRVNIAS